MAVAAGPLRFGSTAGSFGLVVPRQPRTGHVVTAPSALMLARPRKLGVKYSRAEGTRPCQP